MQTCKTWMVLLTAALAGILPSTVSGDPVGSPATGRPEIAPITQRNLHDYDKSRTPQVVDLVLTPDGRYLAAAYHVGADNHAWTNWDTWVAAWDLNTGRRTIMLNGTDPLALSPDGQWLAMALYERSHDRDRRYGPPSAPAMWRLDGTEAPRKLTCDIEPGRLLDVTFGSDGKELFAVSIDGRLVAWDWPCDAPAREIDKLVLDGWDELQLISPSGGWRASLIARDRQLILYSPVDDQVLARAYGMVVEWNHRGTKWIRSDVSMLQLGRSDRAGMMLDQIEMSGKRCDLTLPYPAGQRYMQAEFLPFGATELQHFAFATQQKHTAFIQQGTSLAVVRKLRKEWLYRFPAAAVHSFTPDGTQLIVSDRRGVLRFLDLPDGRIVRTLRLDDKPGDTVLVAAIQTASEFGQVDRNREQLQHLIGQGARRGAQIVVLPETAVTGYLSYDLKQTWRVGDRPVSGGLTGVDPAGAAEPVPGPSTRFFAKLARQWGIYLTVPLLEVDGKTGRYYNSVVLLGPEGDTLIHYRKINPWAWAEQSWASEGNLGHPVSDTPFGRLGVLICFDIHKQAAEMAKLRIDTLLYSIAWVDEAASDWFPTRLPEIARTYGFNIVAANWTLPVGSVDPSWHGYGQSRVIDAAGQTLAKAARDVGDDIILAELPLSRPGNP